MLKVVEVKADEVEEVVVELWLGLVGQVGSLIITLTVGSAPQIWFKPPALMAAANCSGVIDRPRTSLLPMRTEATLGFPPSKVGTRFNRSLTEQSRPPRSGQVTVETTLAVTSCESRQMLAFRLQIGADDVVVVAGPEEVVLAVVVVNAGVVVAKAEVVVVTSEVVVVNADVVVV